MAARVVVRKGSTKKTKAATDLALLEESFRTWAHLKGDEEQAKAKKEVLRTGTFFPALEEIGEVDERGSFIYTFSNPITIITRNKDDVKVTTTYTGLKKQKGVTQIFLEDKATAWLTKNDLLEHVTVEVQVSTWTWDFATGKRVLEKEDSTHLDQDAIYVLNQEGLLSDKVLDTFFEDKVTWSLVPVKA